MAGDRYQRAANNPRGPGFAALLSQAVENPSPGADPGFDAGWDAGRMPEYHRRTNVGNIKALRRAMRRVQGFAKLAHKTISFVHKVKMKKRKR
jgi:hypothetical protein